MEQDLLAGCKKQDPKFQRLLYEKYSGKMYSLCLRYLKDEADAEDVLISGFTKVFTNINQYRGTGSFEGWIRTIMVNEALGFIRKNKSLFVEVDIDHAQQKISVEALESALELEDLFNLVQNLPAGYRTIFNLYAIEGYSHKEISEIMGISVQTSKSQLSRARAVLQKIILNADIALNEKVINHEG